MQTDVQQKQTYNTEKPTTNITRNYFHCSFCQAYVNKTKIDCRKFSLCPLFNDCNELLSDDEDDERKAPAAALGDDLKVFF